MKAFIACNYCNKEFELTDGQEFGDASQIIFTMEQCPHCSKFNHIWMRVEVFE